MVMIQRIRIISQQNSKDRMHWHKTVVQTSSCGQDGIQYLQGFRSFLGVGLPFPSIRIID